MAKIKRAGSALVITVLLLAAALVVLCIWYLVNRYLVVKPQEPTFVTSSRLATSSTFGINPTAAQLSALRTLSQLSKYPFLDLVPTDRSISSFHPTTSQTFTYEGITLMLPWSANPTIQSRASVGTQIRFADGKFVMLVNPYPDQSIRQEFLKSTNTGEDEVTFNYLFGRSNLQSDAAFFNLVISSNLQILRSSTSSPRDRFAQSMLLPIKFSLFSDSSTQAIYRFSTAGLTVFEFSDWPAKQQSYVFLFDSQDHGRLITTSATQGEIDFIISSIREL
jgi:hypothetical protein